MFYDRVSFCCHRLPPQVLCHLPGSSQKNSNRFITLASLDLLLLNLFITMTTAQIYSFPHLKCNSVLLVGFILAYSLLWIQDGTIAVLHECLLCRCKWVFNSSWFIIKNNTNTYKKITQKDIWQNSTGWVLSLFGFGGGFFWGEGCQF